MEEEASARERNRPPQAQYSYLPIADAVKVLGRVCLLATVSQIGAAVKSNGTDFNVTLRVADQSRTAGASITFFAQDAALLPSVNSSGDVISVQNVRVEKYMNNNRFVFIKGLSSFALFESKVSAECSPYQTSVRYDGSKDDKELLTQMRIWLLNNPLEGLKDVELRLKNLKSDFTFDLICKVEYVYKDNGEWIFYVWDGTDTPAAELPAISDAEAIQLLPLLQGSPLPKDVLRKMSSVGTVLRIFSNRRVNEVFHMQNDIYWARFWNITCKQEFGIWKGIFSDSSGVRLLSDRDGSVVDRLRMYESRNANKVHRRPMASIPSNVTVVDDKAGYSTLMDSLKHNEVIHQIKTLVRVVSAFPCRTEELNMLSTGDRGILLILEDHTARIEAYVSKDEMVKFFDGNLRKESIIKKMKLLLGIPEPKEIEEVAPLTRNPPWIWCCLKSYYPDKNKNDPWEGRKYQISATTIRG